MLFYLFCASLGDVNLLKSHKFLTSLLWKIMHLEELLIHFVLQKTEHGALKTGIATVV